MTAAWNFDRAAREFSSIPVPRQRLRDAVGHAVADHPDEACGAIFADAQGRLTRSVRLHNVADRPGDFFSIDPAEQLAVWQQAEDDGLHLAVLYHSHTASRAEPSATDEAHAAYAGADVVHLILSTAPPPTGPEIRAWRWRDGRLAEVRWYEW